MNDRDASCVNAPIATDDVVGNRRQTTFLIRFARGSGRQPELREHYLRWEAGFLHACAVQTHATRYEQPNVARDVATRAERAFPGARLVVMPVAA